MTCLAGLQRSLALLCLGFSLAASAAPPPPSLAEAYKPYFPVGAAVTPGQLMVGAGGDFVARQYNVIVAENAMKPMSLARAGEGEYDFAQADALVDWARARGIKVRGHTLVWHQQTPHWMFEGENGAEVTRETLIERMRRYIHDVVGHFKGRVWAWDVVNEAFVTGEAPGDDAGYRMSDWRRIIGPEYIALAFRFAHEADPDALLIYNDYGTEDSRKREMIVKLVRELQAEGVKIDGVGHQSHYTVRDPQNFAGLEQTIVEVAQLGLTNQITELDISLNADLMRDSIDEITPQLLKRQAARYREIFTMFVKHRDAISAVLMWGLNDEVSWLRSWPRRRLDGPLLFDEELKPKPAFKAVIEAARSAK
jgi:endo-1,4-beta-xylanase